MTESDDSASNESRSGNSEPKNSGVGKPKDPSLLMAGVGTMMPSMIISGFVLGYATDYWLDTLPLFMLLFGGLGILGGNMKMREMLVKNDKQDKQ